MTLRSISWRWRVLKSCVCKRRKGVHTFVCALAKACMCAYVPIGPMCPLLAASWLYSAWLVIKPSYGGNFHTTVNCVRWLKVAQFVVQSHCYSSSLIFFRLLKWELHAAGVSHCNETGSILCLISSVSLLLCQRIFHSHVSNLINAKISCHVWLVFNHVYVINFVLLLLMLSCEFN